MSARARRQLGTIALVVSLASAAAVLRAQAVREFAVTGMVVRVNVEQKTLTVSHQAIAGLMPAMTMPFEVAQASELEGLEPGTIVSFTLKVDRSTSRAGQIRVVRYENVEQDPFSASRLKLMKDLAAQGTAATRMVAVGEMVPGFRLTDQKHRPVALADLRGKVVVVNFVYTTCALPNFCLRLANNFGVLQKRFERQLGRELVLLTLTFDPVHDTPDVLATYARQWSANADTWKFLTGPVADVERACALFGVHAFSNEGLLDHSLHTAVIDRQGRLAANIEGNQFTATQLGDLTQSVLQNGR
jgi:protein SCO1/2